MRRIHVFNPVSGCGHSADILKEGKAAENECYVTQSVGDAEQFVYNTCLKSDEEIHFIVYGGDGTINEVANGILNACAGGRTFISVVPSGTGNDFVRTFTEKNKITTIDAIKYNDRYAVNIINFGFDSNVVKSTEVYKKVFAGSPAYIAGVASNFFKKIGEKWKVTLVDKDDEIIELCEDFTLALIGNCKYYGGGFCSAPLADPSDGLLDFVAVKKVSHLTFASLVGEYKKGKHLNPQTYLPYDKFSDYIFFKQIKKIKIEGIQNICSDGEIEDVTSVDVSVVPGALRVIT